MSHSHSQSPPDFFPFTVPRIILIKIQKRSACHLDFVSICLRNINSLTLCSHPTNDMKTFLHLWMPYIAKYHVFPLVLALFFSFFLHSAVVTSLMPLIFSALSQHEMMRSRESLPPTLTHTIKHIMKTQWITWRQWDFRAQRKVWMTVGGEAAQPILDWHPVAVSAHNMGGNKAQCHGNHIKSTLKLIYLQSNGFFVYINVFFPPGVCFYNSMSISVKI